jgi:hypothetical protein
LPETVRAQSRFGPKEPGMGILKETVKKLPVVAELVKERDKLHAELSAINTRKLYTAKMCAMNSKTPS